MQITTGAQRLGWMDTDLTDDEETNKQVLVIWVITLIATMSVVSGLSVGIGLLSQVGFGLGVILLFLCLIMEKTNCTFDTMVQTIGHCKCQVMLTFWNEEPLLSHFESLLMSRLPVLSLPSSLLDRRFWSTGARRRTSC